MDLPVTPRLVRAEPRRVVGHRHGISLVDREQVAGNLVHRAAQDAPHVVGEQTALGGPGDLPLPQPLGEVERVHLASG